MIQNWKRELRKVYDNIKSPVIFVSYPKAGRTWLRILIANLLFSKKSLDRRVELTQLTRFRLGVKTVIFSHRGYVNQDLIDSKKFPGKNNIVVMVRDPRDILVSSYFEHTKRTGGFDTNKSIASFSKDEKYGIKQIVSFYNKILEVYENRLVAIIKYEDLKGDTFSELEKVMRVTRICKNDFSKIQINDAIENANFSKLKQQARASKNSRLRPGTDNDGESSKFRKGVVGDYRNHFEEDDLIFINESCEELNSKFGYKFT